MLISLSWNADRRFLQGRDSGPRLRAAFPGPHTGGLRFPSSRLCLQSWRKLLSSSYSNFNRVGITAVKMVKPGFLSGEFKNLVWQLSEFYHISLWRLKEARPHVCVPVSVCDARWGFSPFGAFLASNCFLVIFHMSLIRNSTCLFSTKPTGNISGR